VIIFQVAFQQDNLTSQATFLIETSSLLRLAPQLLGLVGKVGQPDEQLRPKWSLNLSYSEPELVDHARASIGGENEMVLGRICSTVVATKIKGHSAGLLRVDVDAVALLRASRNVMIHLMTDLSAAANGIDDQ